MRLPTPLPLVRLLLGEPALFLRYISIGALSALLELGLFSLAYQAFSWPLLAANNGALALAVVFNFTAQKHWTFRVQGGWGRQMPLYALMQAISALLNNLLVFLLIARWDWPPPMAKLVQIGLVFMWNFSFCKLVVFARRPAASDA